MRPKRNPGLSLKPEEIRVSGHLHISPSAFAQGQVRTTDEAKALRRKAAAAMKADKAKTLDLF